MTRQELEIKAKEFDSKLKRHPMSSEELQKVLCDFVEALRIHDVVRQSEQFYCTCSRAKGLDHDEEGTPYCISCQKEVQF